jgi:putative DNA primase/helicase
MLKVNDNDKKLLDRLLPEETKEFSMTDLGNAERLAHRHGKDIRFCHEWNKWLIWSGTHWQIDSSGEIERRAKETIRNLYREASKIIDDAQRKALVQHAQRSESIRSLTAMVNLVKSEPGIPVSSEELDADPYMLNCLNGTIDLTTGTLSPHDQGTLITKQIPFNFNPQQTCPLWLNFLNEIMNGNQNLIEFLQRAVGYSLTGSTGEQCLFMLHGSGANGKTVFMETIRAMLGDYSLQAPAEMLLQRNNSSVPNDVARLKGSRFVAASEIDEGRRMAESLVKQMTGNEQLTARFLRAEFFEFLPEFKLWIGTNHKPTVSGTDAGIWRRIRLIPFEVTIPPAKRDKDLLYKLRAELPGILNWAIEGCLKWFDKGLSEPEEVRAATAGYKCEMDVLAGFLNECCRTDTKLCIPSQRLYKRYADWCRDNGERELTQKTFSMRMTEKGFKKYRTGSCIVWEGVTLISDDETPTDNNVRV